MSISLLLNLVYAKPIAIRSAQVLDSQIMLHRIHSKAIPKLPACLLLLFTLFFSSCQQENLPESNDGVKYVVRNIGSQIFKQKIHNIKFDAARDSIWPELMLNMVQLQFDTDRDEAVYGKPTYAEQDIEIGEQSFASCGLRAKGQYTFQTCTTDKIPWKIDFDRFARNQNWDGLTKVDLRNNIADPSLIRAAIVHTLAYQHGIPAPRTGLASVSFADKQLGYYTIAESIDKTFLLQQYGTTKGTLIKVQESGLFEFRGNKPEQYKVFYQTKLGALDTTFIDLMRAVNRLNGERNDPFEALFDIKTFLKSLAFAEVLAIGDVFNGRNHHLYRHPDSGQWSWIFGITPYAMNSSSKPIYIEDAGSKHVLLHKVMAIPEYKKQYTDWLDYFNREILRRQAAEQTESWSKLIAAHSSESAAMLPEHWSDYLVDKSYVEQATSKPFKRRILSYWDQISWPEEKLSVMRKADFTIEMVRQQVIKNLDRLKFNERVSEGLQTFINRRATYMDDEIEKLKTELENM